MSVAEEILIIANKIANQGKKPSIALIKPHLTTNVPLPVIISILKSWQHEPDYISLKSGNGPEMVPKEAEEITDKHLLWVIDKALVPLKQEIEQLKIEISQLKKVIAN